MRSRQRARFWRRGWSLLFVGWLVCSASNLAWATNFTFFMTADTHYGLDLWANNEPANKSTIDAMNKLPGAAYPAKLGGTVDIPLGVLVAGDLTDTPEVANFYGTPPNPFFKRDGFDDDYRVDGTGRIQYPVYEGYGNHDVDNTTYSYTLEGILARNQVRSGIAHLSDNGLHYSWNWQGVHFINLNLYPGQNERAGFSLDFLHDDLANHVGDGQPIVLMHHFGFDSFSDEWWTQAEQQAYADALAGYNVLGIFHGHLHDSFHYTWNGYDVFDGSAAKDGNFLVVRFTDNKMDVASRESGRWGFNFSKAIVVPEPSSLALMFIAGGCVLSSVIVKSRRRAVPRRL